MVKSNNCSDSLPGPDEVHAFIKDEKENTKNYPFVVAWNKLYKRSFLLDNDLFFMDIKKGSEDEDFYQRLLLNSPSISYNHKSIYYYRERNYSLTEKYCSDPNFIINNISLMQNSINYCKEKTPDLLNDLYIRIYELMISKFHQNIYQEDNYIHIHNFFKQIFIDYRFLNLKNRLKTMLYNDGMIIVEDSSVRAHAIAENAEYTDKLTSIFASYAYKLQGNTYYVAQSSGASDDNPGTEQFPFKTLKKACEIAEAGDTVIIKNGIYREVLAPKNNGTAGAPITFKAMEGEDVTISAFDVLKGFEEVLEDDANYNKNVQLYKVATDIDLGYTRNFILYKGNEIIQGRYPNSKTNLIANSWPDGVTGPLWPTKGNIKVKSKYCNTPSHRDFRVYVSDTDLNQPDDYWKGATFIGEIERGWALTSGKIEYSTEGKIKIDNSTISFCWNQFGKNYGAFASDYGYITDSIKTVDIPGE